MATKRAIIVCCDLCNKPSVAICVACDRHYCWDHFGEHRRTFEKYIDDAREHHRSLSECLIEFEQVENELRWNIDDWERNTIEKVHRSANDASDELETFIRNYRLRFEEESSIVINATPINSDAQVYQIEKLQSEYGHALKNVRLVPHNDQQLILEVQLINLKSERFPLQDSMRTGPYQADVFEPQSTLGKRLVKEPLTTTAVGSYWAIAGSDTHLLVQEYENDQLKMFDRHGKRDMSMTWYYLEVVRDIQWHHKSQQFFILLDKKLIVFNPITKYFQDIHEVTPYQSNIFRRCTCLDDRLFISYWGTESAIELIEISCWKSQQRWLSPVTCRTNELISCIRLSSNEQLALSIQDENNPNNRQFRIELRDLTLNTLHTISLHTDVGIFSRITPLPDMSWAAVNVDGNHVFIISEHGELIDKIDCHQGTLRTIALIGENIVVIRTVDKLLFYDVTFAIKE